MSKPESGEKFESGTELESEPGGEVRLCEEWEAPTVDLVVAENLQKNNFSDVKSVFGTNNGAFMMSDLNFQHVINDESL